MTKSSLLIYVRAMRLVRAAQEGCRRVLKATKVLRARNGRAAGVAGVVGEGEVREDRKQQTHTHTHTRPHRQSGGAGGFRKI